jgi:energy-coupling factor transporter ATP-binding protein EcfA2
MPIVKKICTLVNSTNRPDWWRYTVNTAIEKNELTPTDLEKAYTLAKMEFGLELKNVAYPALSKPVQATGYHAELEEYRLVSISNVENVSALAVGKTIEFSQTGLTVIYGNNGSGKSSYAKVLKNACLTRGEAPAIISNVFSKNTGLPSAHIQVSSSGNTESVHWQNTQESNPKLKSIRVFDSNSSIHYLSKSDALDFKPAALNLLDELLKASAHITVQIKQDEKNYSRCVVLPEMNPGTEASKLSISSNTSVEKIESLCATKDESIELKQLQNEILELSSNTPEVLRGKYKKRRLRLLPFQAFLSNLVEKLSSENIKLYSLNYTNNVKARAAATALSSSTFSGLPVANIGSDEWLTMWRAVESFLGDDYSEVNFPLKEGDHCPTCLQLVDSTSATRQASFNDYLQSQLQKEAEDALINWNANRKTLNKLGFSTEPYTAILTEIETNSAELKTLFDDMITSLSVRTSNILSDEPKFDCDEVNLRALTWLNLQINALSENEKAVQDDAVKALIITNKKLRTLEIEDREKIRTSKALILTEIDKAKKRDMLSKIKQSASTIAITKLINEICDSSEIGKMQTFFNLELEKLGFKHFEIETSTKGTKGLQNFSIKLPNNPAKLLDIVSEGEQKCISLASFFAELEADSRRSAIIFDDPVNSLDHIWRQKFATRIAKEAEQRQVIVLTHDLPFLKMMQETSSDITIKAITRNKTTTGIPLVRPPWDALKTQPRIGLIKEASVKARKASNDSFEEYQTQAGIIYGKMRETWERLVEEWLIRGVVERFNREIKTQSAKHLIDITELDIETLDSAMSKCSAYMHGHDMAEEAAGYFPDIDELESDISALEAYFKGLKARRK